MGVNANHSIGNAPSEWLVDGVPEGGTPYPKFYLDSDDLHYHAHPISSARSIILLFDELAQSHSKITHLFELLDPQLSFGRKRSPREQYKH